MTLSKAIEILSEKVKHPYAQTRLAYPDALKLGIEALKREQHRRHFAMRLLPDELLPGETRELKEV